MMEEDHQNSLLPRREKRGHLYKNSSKQVMVQPDGDLPAQRGQSAVHTFPEESRGVVLTDVGRG